jgi:predicted nucleic acid-binding protein
VRLVIADTGPINYLVLIGEVHVLPLLFAKILLPSVVQIELSDPLAPPLVRKWIANAPPWLEIAKTPAGIGPAGIHPGEAAAIDLAVSLDADLLLIDDRAGVNLARQKGLRVTGTLGVLDLAAARGLLDFKQAIERLRATTFRFPEAILAALFEKHSGGNTG